MDNPYGRDLLMMIGIDVEQLPAFEDAFIDGKHDIVALLKPGYDGLRSDIMGVRRYRSNGAYMVWSPPHENAQVLANIWQGQEKHYQKMQF